MHKFNSIQRRFKEDLFPEYSMGMWYVYLLTDANRSQFNTGLCSDLPEFLSLIKRTERLGPSIIGLQAVDRAPARLVFIEAFNSVLRAEMKLNEINSYTRMQKEKIIRKYNPDWKDLRTDLNGSVLRGPAERNTEISFMEGATSDRTLDKLIENACEKAVFTRQGQSRPRVPVYTIDRKSLRKASIAYTADPDGLSI